MTDLDDLFLPASAISFYAASWIVTHTAAPEGWRTHISIGLLFVGAAALFGGARAVGVDLSYQRCAAQTTDGSRCRREAESLTGDLCWQHRKLADVEIHPSAIDSGAVPAEEIGER